MVFPLDTCIMYFYKKIQKFPVQIVLYGTWPKFKKCLKNWFRPLGVNCTKSGCSGSMELIIKGILVFMKDGCYNHICNVENMGFLLWACGWLESLSLKRQSSYGKS
jgi:hypothetical protein